MIHRTIHRPTRERITVHAITAGRACVSRTGFGVAPNNLFVNFIALDGERIWRKPRDREDALANTRDACATRRAASLARFRHGA